MEVKLENIKAYQSLPTIKSTDLEWIKWSDQVMGKYGADLGKQIFLAAWNKRGSKAANTVALRRHIKDHYNLEIDESVWNKVADLGAGISQGLGKIVRVGTVTVLVVGGIMLITMVATIAITMGGRARTIKTLIKSGSK